MLQEWVDPTGFSAKTFDEFYYPARLLGKVWTEEECPPSASPTTSSPTRGPTQSPVTPATPPPSRAPSTPPSKVPTTSPSSSPSTSPSKAPSTSPSSTPSSSPTVHPTSATQRPTVSADPTFSPSTSPTLTTEPTPLASSSPSIEPTVSQAPSHSPSTEPSLIPSTLPSLVPSTEPTTTLNYLTLTDEFKFYISAPPGKEAQVGQDIIGNVTESFENSLFNDPDNFLYVFVTKYGLRIADIPEPLKVNLTETNDAENGKSMHPQFAGIKSCRSYYDILTTSKSSFSCRQQMQNRQQTREPC